VEAAGFSIATRGGAASACAPCGLCYPTLPHKLQADPAHSTAVRGRDEGHAQGEAAGEGTAKV
jgi:hypothetical protein